MAVPPIEDVLELQQLLARYAVGMTKDDVESVMEVFTPDGSYSAFGQVVTGMDAVDRIVSTPTSGSRPQEPQVIERALVIKAPADAVAWKTQKEAQK